MPSSDPIQRFLDIVENIERINRYVASIDLTAFLDGGVERDAIERCLERICEASAKLGTTAVQLCPEIEWPKLRSLGNFLRHEYDGIDPERIWFMVERDIPALKTVF